jgi:hypothetical protein
MSGEPSLATTLFYKAVTTLRLLHPRYREMALYAANHWSDARLLNGEAAGDLPGDPGALAEPEPPPPAPVLKLVFPPQESAG